VVVFGVENKSVCVDVMDGIVLAVVVIEGFAACSFGIQILLSVWPMDAAWILDCRTCATRNFPNSSLLIFGTNLIWWTFANSSSSFFVPFALFCDAHQQLKFEPMNSYYHQLVPLVDLHQSTVLLLQEFEAALYNLYQKQI